jgi:hypothetical protein
MTRPAGPVSATGHAAHHAALAYITGHLVVILLVLGVIFLGLLAAPVIFDAVFGSIQGPAEKWAGPVFALGAGLLVVGLLAGLPKLDLIGGGLMGVIAVGWILVYY